MDLKAFREELRTLDEKEARLLIKQVYQVYRQEMNRKTARVAAQFEVGDRVEFRATYKGARSKWTGTVVRVNQRSVSVDAESVPLFNEKPVKVNWRVAPQFLTKVTA